MSIRKINIFNKIGNLIPGYSERDSRKNCDKKLRIFLSERLKKFEDLISEKIVDTINESKLENLAYLETLICLVKLFLLPMVQMLSFQIKKLILMNWM